MVAAHRSQRMLLPAYRYGIAEWRQGRINKYGSSVVCSVNLCGAYLFDSRNFGRLDERGWGGGRRRGSEILFFRPQISGQTFFLCSLPSSSPKLPLQRRPCKPTTGRRICPLQRRKKLVRMCGVPVRPNMFKCLNPALRGEIV